MLSRDKRISRTILTTEGNQSFTRYRLFAVSNDDYPQSEEICKRMFGGTSVYPMDIYMGIENLPFKVTVDAALRIARYGATSTSYMEAVNCLKESFGYRLSDNQVREITDYIGDIVLTEDIRQKEERLASYHPKAMRIARRGRRPKDGFVLYCEVDGAMFNTRRSKEETEALRKAGKSNWMENKLGVVFRSDELIDTGKEDDDGNLIMRLGRREYVGTTQGVEEFRERLASTLLKNGMKEASAIVLISDGAPWIRRTREQYFPNATQILDLFHLKENVMKFAQYLFSNDKSKYYPWWKAACKLLEDGKWRDLLNQSEVTEYKSMKDTPGGVPNLYQYIWNNRDIIDYPAYKAKGYFVGSGAIESGHKTVMQERIKLAGMRWYQDSAEKLMALRTKLRSSLWESEVVPLVRTEYSRRHMVEGNVRQKQRRAHSKNSGKTQKSSEKR